MAINGDRGDSPQLKEWAECRKTIGRLDTILEDLRKYGFSLITGLLTASTFLGYALGHPNAGVGAFIAVMCLIAALFSVDVYYSVLQSAAVERALDLEVKSDPPLADPPILVTRYINHRAQQARSRLVILGFYFFLLVVAGGLGAVAATSSGNLSASLVLLTVVIGVLLFGTMLGYWIYVANETGLHGEKERIWSGPDPFVVEPPGAGRAE